MITALLLFGLFGPKAQPALKPVDCSSRIHCIVTLDRDVKADTMVMLTFSLQNMAGKHITTQVPCPIHKGSHDCLTPLQGGYIFESAQIVPSKK